MARIQMLDSSGKKLTTTDGRAKTIFSVDGNKRVAKGELKGVYELQQIGDRKRNMLVAYRPVSEDDKKADLAAKKAEMAKLQADINAAENVTPKASKSVAAKKPAKVEDKSEDAFESDIEAAQSGAADVPDEKADTDTKSETKAAEGAPKAKGRVRPTRQTK